MGEIYFEWFGYSNEVLRLILNGSDPVETNLEYVTEVDEIHFNGVNEIQFK